MALYLTGLHRCADQTLVVTTIAWKREDQPESFTVQAWATTDEVQMSFIDGELSPWASHEYLGKMLSAEDARASELRPRTLEVAEMICSTVPEVVSFLDESVDAK